MAQNYTFDIVSDYDLSEVTNAVDQARREILNRYDFKGTPAGIDFLSNDKTGVRLEGDSAYQLDAVLDVFKKKLIKREVPLATLDIPAKPAGGQVLRWEIMFKKGLDQDKAKQITKLIKSELPKVKTQIQDQTVRASSPSKDDLQSAMTLLRSREFDFPLQFVNFR